MYCAISVNIQEHQVVEVSGALHCGVSHNHRLVLGRKASHGDYYINRLEKAHTKPASPRRLSARASQCRRNHLHQRWATGESSQLTLQHPRKNSLAKRKRLRVHLIGTFLGSFASLLFVSPVWCYKYTYLRQYSGSTLVNTRQLLHQQVTSITNNG